MRLYRMNRYSHTLFVLIFNSIKSETLDTWIICIF